MAQHEHFAERDAFEGIIDNATPKFRWLYAGVEDLEAPLLETSMAAFESYVWFDRSQAARRRARSVPAFLRACVRALIGCF